MAGAGDPVATGLVASFDRPGGNVTGLSSGGAEVAGKSVELIREFAPSARRIGVFADETDPFAKPYLAQIGQAARSAGMEMETILTRPGQSVEAAFETLTGKRVDGLVIQGSIVRKEMLDLAIKHRLPPRWARAPRSPPLRGTRWFAVLPVPASPAVAASSGARPPGQRSPVSFANRATCLSPEDRYRPWFIATLVELELSKP